MIKDILNKYSEIIRYLVVGILTTIVSVGTYFLCVSTCLNPGIAWQLQLSNIISWILAVSFAYFMNRKFVFKSKTSHIFKEVCSFFISRVGTLLMDMSIMFIAVTLCGLNDKIAKMIVQVIVTVGNYILSKFFVFNDM